MSVYVFIHNKMQGGRNTKPHSKRTTNTGQYSPYTRATLLYCFLLRHGN